MLLTFQVTHKKQRRLLDNNREGQVQIYRCIGRVDDARLLNRWARDFNQAKLIASNARERYVRGDHQTEFL